MNWLMSFKGPLHTCNSVSSSVNTQKKNKNKTRTAGDVSRRCNLEKRVRLADPGQSVRSAVSLDRFMPSVHVIMDLAIQVRSVSQA